MNNKQWLKCIINVSFDNEEGQVISFIHPDNNIDKNDLKKITFYSFPETNAFSE